MDTPYVNSTQKFKTFLSKLPSIGVPEKVDLKFLSALGYKSSNDRQFVRMLKFLGLIDNSTGQPTDLWTLMRSDFGSAIATGVKHGYQKLFQLHPNAHTIDTEALNAFFKTNTELGDESVTRVVTTFKTLVELGNFSKSHEGSVDSRDNTQKSTDLGNHRVANQTPSKWDSAAPVVLNLNVQLQVPPDSSGEIYEKFFDAMNKYLIKPANDS